MSTLNPFIKDPSQSQKKHFLDAAIAQRMVEKFVVFRYPELNIVNVLTNTLGKPKIHKAGSREFEIAFKGNTHPAATIATRTTQNGNLVLTFDDPKFIGFRVKEEVRANNGTRGRVVSKSAGEAVISFLASNNPSATGFVAADFAANERVSGRGILDDVEHSNTVERFITDPLLYKNLIGQCRESHSVTMNELGQETYIQNFNGTMYYAFQAELEMYQRISRKKAVDTYDSLKINRGDVVKGEGFIQQIKSGGGTTRSFSSLSEVQSDDFWTKFIDSMITNNASPGGEYLSIIGSSLMGQFQQGVGKELVVETGIHNTVGGAKVEGINVMTYTYNGKKLKFVVDPLFNNQEVFSEMSVINPGTTVMSNSAFLLDTSSVEVEGDGMIPFIRDYYYGTVQDMIVGGVDGLIDMKGNPSARPANGSLTPTIDCVWNKTCQLMNPAAHGFMTIAG